MSGNRDVVVYKHGSEWAVKSDGASRAAGVSNGPFPLELKLVELVSCLSSLE